MSTPNTSEATPRTDALVGRLGAGNLSVATIFDELSDSHKQLERENIALQKRLAVKIDIQEIANEASYRFINEAHVSMSQLTLINLQLIIRSSIEQANIALQQQLSALLPVSFYAELPLSERIAIMVSNWNKSAQACEDLEKQLTAAQSEVQKLKADLEIATTKITTQATIEYLNENQNQNTKVGRATS